MQGRKLLLSISTFTESALDKTGKEKVPLSIDTFPITLFKLPIFLPVNRLVFVARLSGVTLHSKKPLSLYTMYQFLIDSLPIVIGAFEAQSIAIALEKDIRPPRPLTHDLFKNFADCFGVIVKQVIIHMI